MEQLLDARTEAERAFLRILIERIPDIQIWFHSYPDGRPWLIASIDFTEGKWIRDTLRLDFDGGQILGGWSPAYLNWDGGVPATEAEIDISPPEGISLSGQPPEELAIAAAEWFIRHLATYATSVRGTEPMGYIDDHGNPVIAKRDDRHQ